MRLKHIELTAKKESDGKINIFRNDGLGGEVLVVTIHDTQLLPHHYELVKDRVFAASLLVKRGMEEGTYESPVFPNLGN